MRRQVASEKCVEKIATEQGEKEQLTQRAGMPWRHQAQRAAAAHISRLKRSQKSRFLKMLAPFFKHTVDKGARVAQLVKPSTSAQVTISWLVSSSPASGSVLPSQSLEPASDSVSPSPSAPPLLCLSLSLSKINIKKFF